MYINLCITAQQRSTSQNLLSDLHLTSFFAGFAFFNMDWGTHFSSCGECDMDRLGSIRFDSPFFKHALFGQQLLLQNLFYISSVKHVLSHVATDRISNF
jgi:hypothetical protein